MRRGRCCRPWGWGIVPRAKSTKPPFEAYRDGLTRVLGHPPSQEILDHWCQGIAHVIGMTPTGCPEYLPIVSDSHIIES